MKFPAKMLTAVISPVEGSVSFSGDEGGSLKSALPSG